jgi:hypothetical protein
VGVGKDMRAMLPYCGGGQSTAPVNPEGERPPPPGDTIPAHLRRAVWLRDGGHCGFPGCADRHCQVHHVIPVSAGGPTALPNLVLGCAFHHLIAIHEWGWHLIVNPDGTKTAISPDGAKVLHSHDPPQAA